MRSVQLGRNIVRTKAESTTCEQFVDSTSTETLTLVNPFDDSIIPTKIQTAGRKEVDAAVTAAHRARREGPWGKFTGAQRQECLLKFADLVENNADRLATLESLPSGKPVTALKMFDIAHMVQVYRYYAGLADKISGDSYPEENGVYKIVRYEPLGVCAGIASWNATFMYIGWKIAPALAAGNCVSSAVFDSFTLARRRTENGIPAVHLQSFREVTSGRIGSGPSFRRSWVSSRCCSVCFWRSDNRRSSRITS